MNSIKFRVLIMSALITAFSAQSVFAAASGENMSAGEAAASSAQTVSVPPARVLRYPEVRGVVNLTLTSITSRIKTDNDEYAVTQKRAEILNRNLATAMHEKYVAENRDAPQPVFAAQRIAHEMQLYTDWKNAELLYDSAVNDVAELYDEIKSDLKNQYTTIIELEKSLLTYRDELLKLDEDIRQLEARIEVGVAKAADMDAYDSQKVRLLADITACERDIELLKFNLKNDLKIDQEKDISLAPFNETFVRFDDRNIKRKIADAVGASFAVTSSERKLAILKEERAIMLLWDRDGAMMNRLPENEISLKETEYSIITARNTEEASLWADYYALLNQEDTIKVEELNAKTAENAHKAAAARLDLGLAIPLDEQIARIELESARSTLKTAINDYVRMAEDYELDL